MAQHSFIIHHLSDIHIGASHYHAHVKLPLPVNKGRNTEAYLNHLAGLEPSAFPDLVIVSGDLTSLGSEDEMDAAEDFLGKIVAFETWNHKNALRQDAPRVMIIPGNHDLDWSKETPEEKHRRFCRLSDALGSGVLSSKYIRTPQKPWCDFGNEANLFVFLLNSTPHGGIKDPALSNIFELIRDKANQFGLTPDALEAFNHQVRKDPGFVLDAEIASLKREAARAPAERVKIAVVHHNPNHVPTDDQEVFDTIVNSGALKSALLQSGYHMVLHGHRHVFHTSVESHPGSAFSQNSCHFIGADSMGCKEDAPFVEIVLNRKDQSNGTAARTSAAVRQFFYTHPNGYLPSSERCGLQLGRSMFYDLGELLENETASSEIAPAAKQLFLSFWPNVLRLYSELSPRENEYGWVAQFHNQLGTYSRIWATALFGPQAITDPTYHSYLRQQYVRRLELTKHISDKILFYSPEVYQAIVRAHWRPAQELWGDYEIKPSTRTSPTSLEVARIAIIDSSADLVALENLYFDHSVCAIPLFAIERKHVDEKLIINCAIGFDWKGDPLKAYALNKTTNRVEEQSAYAGTDLMNTFEQLLSNRRLKTAYEFVGHQKMFADQADLLVSQYARVRKASPLVLRVLREHLPEKGESGVDLCCGTGNYTEPFAQRFSELYGLDESPDMLCEAGKNIKGVKWIRADAKNSTIPSNTCNAAWMISALHYFHGDEQPMLFAEVFRFMKPGGVFIADTEFAEQHASLWIVEYFPSLKRRYKDSLFSREQYRQWLKDAGFSSIDFQIYEYPADEADFFLRIGQNDPKVYLKPEVRTGIPAFQTMDPQERRRGFDRLQDEIKTGEAMRVRERYVKSAQLAGDLGFIIARK